MLSFRQRHPFRQSRQWSPKGETIVVQHVSAGTTCNQNFRVPSGTTQNVRPITMCVVSRYALGAVLMDSRNNARLFPALTCWATIVSPFGL